MIRHAAVGLSILLVGGCSSQLSTNSAMVDARIPVANKLESQQQYADALTQWKIMQAALPDDPRVRENINRIELQISNQLVSLFEQLDNAKRKGNKRTERTLYLKILALQPNNAIAKQQLREIEWLDALDKAVAKTENINQYFAENQAKAQEEIALNKLLEQGQQFTQDKKYNALLQLADQFESKFPGRTEPKKYRLFAYTKLAEQSLGKKNIEAAIPLFEKAIEQSQGNNKALLDKTATLKQRVAKKYLALGQQSFKSDLDNAIEMFTLSLKFQPDDNVARQQLQRATTIKENLDRIKKLNANSN